MHPVFAQALRPFAPPSSSVHKLHKLPALPSFKTTIGENLSVQVFYDYTPPEAPVYDLNSPLCGPGCPADVDICEVMLMGEDVRDLLADSVIEMLEEQALERHV